MSKSLFINGVWLQGSGSTFEKTNPVDNQNIWSGAEATAADVEQACQAARTAFPAWARLPLAERVAIVEKFAALLEENKKHLAEVISQETSKPFWETLTEVQSMIGKVAISIRAYHQRTGESSTEMADGVASLRHRPHGVLAVFGPYNFRAIYQMGILFLHCLLATQLYLNQAN